MQRCQSAGQAERLRRACKIPNNIPCMIVFPAILGSPVVPIPMPLLFHFGYPLFQRTHLCLSISILGIFAPTQLPAPRCRLGSKVANFPPQKRTASIPERSVVFRGGFAENEAGHSFEGLVASTLLTEPKWFARTDTAYNSRPGHAGGRGPAAAEPMYAIPSNPG